MLKEIKEIRKEMYDYNYGNYPFAKRWKWFFYRKIKAVMYMEIGAWLAYLCIKLKIEPNSVTITYTILGIIGGILLAMATKVTVVLAAMIFFFRPFLDWVDGVLARRLNKVTITGHVLDPYGALVGWIFQLTGLSIYVAVKSGYNVYFYIAALIPIMFSLNIKKYIMINLLNWYLEDKESFGNMIGEDVNMDNLSDTGSREFKSSILNRLKKILLSIFECNARTVDFICFILIIETFSSIFISWLVVLCYISKEVLIYFYSFLLLSKGVLASDLYKLIYKKIK